MKTLTLTLVMSQLLDDVYAKIHYTGRNRGETTESRQRVMQLNEEDNSDLILRSFSSAMGTITNAIADYTPMTATVANDANLTEGVNIEVTLKVPQNYNDRMVYQLPMVMHRLLVDTAIADWFKVTSPDDAAVYAQQVALDINALRDALSRRNRPLRTDDYPHTNPAAPVRESSVVLLDADGNEITE